MRKCKIGLKRDRQHRAIRSCLNRAVAQAGADLLLRDERKSVLVSRLRDWAKAIDPFVRSSTGRIYQQRIRT
jgi:hypothetical protein